jgi:hypothetical protein
MSIVSANSPPVPTVPLPKPRRPRKPAAEVHGTCRWLLTPIAVRDFESGVLAINADEYVVTLGPDRSGARLTKADGTVYHCDLQAGTCDCPDSTYRQERLEQGGCKHRKALAAAVAALPQKQKHAACPSCCERVEAPGLCDKCRDEEEAFAAYHEAEEMVAGGIDPWAEHDGVRYEPTDEPPELPESAYFDPAELSMDFDDPNAPPF